MKIKKGDTVTVIAGKDRGRQGKIMSVLPRRGGVIVEGVNLRRRHEKPKRQGQKGQVVSFAAPLHLSNVMLWCGRCGRGVRLGAKLEGGKKVRVCRRCDQAV